jgi:predicted aldo/keto reductase-like oxidoreductase
MLVLTRRNNEAIMLGDDVKITILEVDGDRVKIGIDAPRIVELYNDALLFSDDRLPKLLYRLEGHSDLDCLKCGKCTERCPKHLPLAEALCNCRDLLQNHTTIKQ